MSNQSEKAEKKRKAILKKIEANHKKSLELKKEALELCKEYIQVNCEEQWYSESQRTTGRGKNKRTFLEGRFNWKQDFKDNDTNEIFRINRSRPVKENNQWDEIAVLALIGYECPM